MENKILKTKLIDWENLKPFQPDDFKKITENQLIKLKTSLKKNGFMSPFYVWETEEGLWCLDGHMRIPAMKLLLDEGEIIPKKLPANFVDCKNKKQAKKAVLIYNAQYAKIIQESMDEFIKDLNLDDINNEIEIKDITFTSEVSETKSDDEVPENVKSMTKLGDLWELGRHRVYCADSTEQKAIQGLTRGAKANMVFTDPPYNVSYGTSKFFSDCRTGYSNEQRPIKNDSLSAEEWIKFNERLANIFKEHCTGDIYVWGASGYDGMKSRCIFIESGLHWSATIIWKKDRMVLTPAKYQRMYEPCLYGWFHKSSFVGDRKNVEVWEINRPLVSKLHPTMKPLEICEKGIKLSSKEDDIVMDLFLGSGSTLIACEKTKRICYGAELDPGYCDVIATRYRDWCLDNNIKPVIKLNGQHKKI